MVLKTMVTISERIFLSLWMEGIWIETIAFVGMYNRSPSTIMHSFSLVELFFYMVIKVQSEHN